MKRILLFTAMLLVILTASAQYVDLGLPSGTQWKQTNEIGYYTYDGAMTEFGSQLPTVTQQDELREYCTWTWMGDGYKVIGPNGNFIYLPAAGGINIAGEVAFVGSWGFYWSSTPIDLDYAHCLWFSSDIVYPNEVLRHVGQSIRLIRSIQPSPEEADKSIVHVEVDEMPEFPGGFAEMNSYLASNLSYPSEAMEKGIEGRVVCQFTVDADGSIVDVNIVRSVETSLDAEVIRLVKSMPKWTPGRKDGKAVRCRFTIPIRFRIPKEADTGN